MLLKAIKCSCNKAWCPVCSKRSVIKPLIDHVHDWDSSRVRMITLTIDPAQFDHDPEKAYDYLMEKKAIPQLFHNLKRTVGKDIVDWERILEFHKNGFPHWHILVLVGKSGKAGMIGGDNLRDYWPYGRVHETYFKTDKDFKNFFGYFEKHGYFEDKKGKEHQVCLPDWARNRFGVIRRRTRKKISREFEPSGATIQELKNRVFKGDDNELTDDEKLDKLGAYFDRVSKNEFMTEGEKLDKCGCAVSLYRGLDFSDYIGVSPVPYFKFIKEVPGKFVKGSGYCFEVDEFSLDTFLNAYEVYS